MGEEIRFQDGASYENMMGVWSRLVGESFLDWVSPVPGQKWVDVGCGNGAFTELIVERCAPIEVHGIDPAEPQLEFARQRHRADIARFWQGSAMALPFPDDDFDAAASALVIFFMPDPAKGVAEMARVVRPGGTVSTYAWDLLGGGFPYRPVEEEMLALGATPLTAPRAEAAELANLSRLWSEAGLEAVETREIGVKRVFDSFERYWAIAVTTPGIGPVVAKMPAAQSEELRHRVEARTAAAADGRISLGARAHAVKGVVPGR